MPPDLIGQINALRQRLESIEGEFYRNNFPSSQDHQKYVRFNSRLKVPSYSSAPATCEVGEICEVGGKLKICSAANTWTTVGTQV